MEIEETVDEQFKKGFEQGYWLELAGREELPEILTKTEQQKEYHSGLVAGSNEAKLEKFRTRMAEHDQQRENDRDHEIG